MAGKAQYTVKFNELAIGKVIRTNNGQQREWQVDGVPGLSIVVKPSGAASFHVRYQVGTGRTRIRKRTAIGRYGVLELSKAREKAHALMSRAEAGENPVEVDRAKAEAEAAKANALTLIQLFEERAEKDDRRAQRTIEDYRDVLKAHVFPKLGKLPAGEITPEQIADVLEKIEDKSKHVAHKARSALGSTYRWAMGRRKVRVNPVAGLGFTYQGKPRNRVLNDTELCKLTRAVDGENFGATEPMRLLVKLALLTGQRNSEVAGARIAELTLDSANPLWRIPAERMKRKSREQMLPLSRQAAALFTRAVELAKAKGSKFVFPGSTQGRRIGAEWRAEHIGQESVSRAMMKLRSVAHVKDARVHDFRKVVTTWLREHGTSSEVCDLILHHARPGVTGSHYDFATLEGPVRQALQRWADHVDQVASDKPASNVRQLARV